MAMYDWNGNGNRSDMADNFIEYQIYKDCTSNRQTPRGRLMPLEVVFGLYLLLHA